MTPMQPEPSQEAVERLAAVFSGCGYLEGWEKLNRENPGLADSYRDQAKYALYELGVAAAIEADLRAKYEPPEAGLEIDAAEFAEARKDPAVRQLLDRLVETYESIVAGKHPEPPRYTLAEVRERLLAAMEGARQGAVTVASDGLSFDYGDLFGGVPGLERAIATGPTVVRVVALDDFNAALDALEHEEGEQ